MGVTNTSTGSSALLQCVAHVARSTLSTLWPILPLSLLLLSYFSAVGVECIIQLRPKSSVKCDQSNSSHQLSSRSSSVPSSLSSSGRSSAFSSVYSSACLPYGGLWFITGHRIALRDNAIQSKEVQGWLTNAFKAVPDCFIWWWNSLRCACIE